MEATRPTPTDLEKFHPGDSRTSVEEDLGAPVDTSKGARQQLRFVPALPARLRRSGQGAYCGRRRCSRFFYDRPRGNRPVADRGGDQKRKATGMVLLPE